MRAAIYCRLSREQTGGKKGQSVDRQAQTSREFAEARGWSVQTGHVFVDDGISGAEFERRPGLQAMLAAAARGEFRALIVSEQKSLGRESFGVGALIKELAEADVEVWSYTDEKTLTPRNAMEKAQSSLQSYGDEAHREATAKRNYDAAMRKHKSGHVVGGRVFGYRNVHVYAGEDAHGNPMKSHTDREIVPEQAATVLRIFDMFAGGMGLKAIAKRLYAENVPGPIPFARKDGGGLAPFRWAPSTVQAILKRELYRGVYVWNRSKKRNDWGKKKQRPRPESDWKRTPKPEWRIISDDLWFAVAARRKEVAEACAAMRMSDGKLSGRLPKGKVTNLLAGLAKCAVCGGGLVVETYRHSKKKGKPRVPHYVCNRRRASGACTNTLRIPLEDMHEAVLTAIEEHALTPEAVEAVVRSTQRDVSATVARSFERELKELEKRIARLTDAIVAGGEMPALLGKMKELEARRAAIRAEQASAQPLPTPPRSVIEDRLAEWRRLLRASVPTGRAVLERVLTDRITFTPVGASDDTETAKPVGYEFECPTRYDRLFSGVVVPKSALTAHGMSATDVYYRAEDTGLDFGEILRGAMVRESNRTRVASPTGFEPVSWP